MEHNIAAESQRLALAGLILIVGFIGFSLTESILERSRSIIFFSFYLATSMALLQASRQKECSDIVPNGDEGVEPCKKDSHEIILEKDVSEVFKDSESVNHALRMLMNLAEKSVRK